VSGSRFVATQTPSRFLQVAAAPVSRFLVKHPKLSRFIAHLPGVSRFIPRNLGEGAFMTLPTAATVEHVAPVYNARARKQHRPSLKM